MREPVKRLKLCEAIKADIANGVYLPGSFLPNELELAKKYGHARDTLRLALTILEDEKIIELLKGRGRRVCPGIGAEARPLITFLLPCADFLSETFPFAVAQMTRRMLKGVSQVAFEYNCRLETVPVSPTNNAHDIDWRRLDFINSDSKVLAFGYWYCDLFPLFKKLGCRVSFIENQSNHFKIYTDFLKDWAVFTLDRFNAAKAAVRFLAERGCRRIALARCDLDKKDHPSLLGYKSGLAECGLNYATWHNILDTDDEFIAGIIAGFYEKNKFDALLLDPYLICKLRTQHSLNRALGLPESVKIMADFETSCNQQVFPSLSSLDFPYEEIGRVAAQRLLEDEFRTGQQIFSARIIERESTMHERERLVI